MKATLTALACAGVLLTSAVVRADNTADEADIAFTLGNQAFVKRDYEKALSWYFLSNRLVPNRNVLFNIARCFEALNKFDEAFRYYFELSGVKLAADDARDVKAALARLSPKVALLTVTSDPEGADVYIDREDLGSRGRAPLTLALPTDALEIESRALAPGTTRAWTSPPGSTAVTAILKARAFRLTALEALGLEARAGEVPVLEVARATN